MSPPSCVVGTGVARRRNKEGFELEGQDVR